MNDSQLALKGFVVWSICSLFFLYEFSLRTVIGTYQAPIMQDLALTTFQFSLLSSTVFLLVYGMMQIPTGLIVDNIGLKKSLIIGALFCTVSSVGFAYAHNYTMALTYRILMGFGASFGFICVLVSVYDWMPHKYIAIFIGLSQFIGTLGPMIATGPLETLMNSSKLNWRDLFLSLGLLGMILIFLIFFLVENNQQKTGGYTILYKPETVSNAISRLFSSIQPWYIATLSASLYFTIEYLSENEGRAFLGLKGIPTSHAGYMLTISWIGYAVGSPLLGLLSDILERRKMILHYCSLLGLISIVMILYLADKTYLQLAFFMLGLSASGQSIAFAAMSEQFKKQFVAVGFALNNMLITTTSAINAPVIGLFLDQIKSGKSLSLENYLYVFNLLIVMTLVAIIISTFFIKETFCKSAVDLTILKKQDQ